MKRTKASKSNVNGVKPDSLTSFLTKADARDLFQ
jgi:hypothetical protein